MSTRISRARLALSAVAATGLCLAGTAVLAAPSHADAGTCDAAYPIDQLTAGQPVTGLTVTQGNDPESGAFTGSILGVMKDGIEPGVDMIMARLTSDQIDESGIWEGMSGSPVYAQDGTLIGAVAYTLSYGATSVAGITPWQDMSKFAGEPAPARVPVGSAVARRIAAGSEVTKAQATQGFSELQAPALISGLGARGLSRASGRPYLKSGVVPAGQADASPTTDDMVAGGNLVATESTGDIVFGAIGTVTSVCNGTVVGFGHPFEFTGRSSYGMAGADTLLVQTDPLGSSFKVANIGGVVGTVKEDRMTGIAGVVGPGPDSFDVTSDMTYTPDEGDAVQRTGVSHVQLPAAAADITFYELMANHQAVIDAYQGGSEAQSWTVTGHTTGGQDFTLSGGNRYTDTSDIAFTSGFDLPDLLWLLTHVSGVHVDSVDVHSAVTDATDVHQIAGAQQKRSGHWVTLDKTHPAVVKAGKNATLRLRYAGGDHGKAFKVAIPAKASGSGRMFLQESEQYWFERSFPSTLAGVTRLVNTMPRNDQASYSLGVFGKGRSVEVDGRTTPESEVITGHGSFRVVVR